MSPNHPTPQSTKEDRARILRGLLAVATHSAVTRDTALQVRVAGAVALINFLEGRLEIADMQIMQLQAKARFLGADVALWKDRYESLLRDAQASEKAYDEALRHD